MICNICGSSNFTFVRKYMNQPDKYEQWVGIEPPICRSWWKCGDCGLYRAVHTYDPNELRKIYSDGYRAKEFRSQPIETVFKSVIGLPLDVSENKQRIQWLLTNLGYTRARRTICDIGAGLGVFLYELIMAPFTDWAACAIEPNMDSVKFINDTMPVVCQWGFYPDQRPKAQMDVIACIHTLEHIKDPESFLCHMRDDLKKGGTLFIEVPDAVEFDYLNKDHDEFNSCHLFFFTPETLIRLVESSGLCVTDVHRIRTKARDLSRIMLLAERR